MTRPSHTILSHIASVRSPESLCFASPLTLEVVLSIYASCLLSLSFIAFVPASPCSSRLFCVLMCASHFASAGSKQTCRGYQQCTAAACSLCSIRSGLDLLEIMCGMQRISTLYWHTLWLCLHVGCSYLVHRRHVVVVAWAHQLFGSILIIACAGLIRSSS